MERVKVEVRRVKYPHPKEGEQPANGECFYVLDVWDLAAGVSYMAKGMLWVAPQPKMVLTLEGAFIEWNGIRQFAWKKAEYTMPVSEWSMLQYACSLTKGMGEAMAAKIWELKSGAWREVKAGDVPGFTEIIATAFTATLAKLELYASYHQAIVWMLEHGLTEKQANKAFDHFGGSVVSIIEGNPYMLMNIDGIGFGIVDTRIRGYFDIKDDDARRLAALIDTAVANAAAEEGSAPSWAGVWRRICDMLDGTAMAVEDVVLAKVKEFFDAGKLMRGDGERLMRATDYLAEREIWDFTTIENAEN